MKFAEAVVHSFLDHDLETARVGHTSSTEIVIVVASGLGTDYSEIKKRRQDAINVIFDVLHAL